MNTAPKGYPCTTAVKRPAQRIEIMPIENRSAISYAVLECDEDDSMYWLRSAHPTPHEAAYAAAVHSRTTGLPLWFPRIDGGKHPVLQALEDVLFAEGVIAFCTGQDASVCWHQLQTAGFNAAAARYPQLAAGQAA